MSERASWTDIRKTNCACDFWDGNFCFDFIIQKLTATLQLINVFLKVFCPFSRLLRWKPYNRARPLDYLIGKHRTTVSIFTIIVFSVNFVLKRNYKRRTKSSQDMGFSKLLGDILQNSTITTIIQAFFQASNYTTFANGLVLNQTRFLHRPLSLG